jgi:hypothetical protein
MQNRSSNSLSGAASRIIDALLILARWLWHLIYVAGTLALAAFLGAKAGAWFYHEIIGAPIPIPMIGKSIAIGGVELKDAAVLAVPLTIVMTAWKDVVKIVLSIWDTLTKLSAKPKILPDAAGLSALFAYGAVAVLTLSNGDKPPSNSDLPAIVNNEVDLLLVSPAAVAAPRLRYLFPLATTKNKVEPKDWAGFEFSTGHKLAPEDRALMDIGTVVNALGGCARRKGAPPATVRIVGYADQNEFGEWTQEKSNEANLRLANARADDLHQHFLRYIKSGGLNVIATKEEWTTLDDMKRDPGYLNAERLRDLREKTGLPGELIDQGQFNRRADIELVDLSDCRPLQESNPS